MSYHDSCYQTLKNKGMAVVNPLHAQQKRLADLEDLLREIAGSTSDIQLKDKIGQVLNGPKEK